MNIQHKMLSFFILTFAVAIYPASSVAPLPNKIVPFDNLFEVFTPPIPSPFSLQNASSVTDMYTTWVDKIKTTIGGKKEGTKKAKKDKLKGKGKKQNKDVQEYDDSEEIVGQKRKGIRNSGKGSGGFETDYYYYYDEEGSSFNGNVGSRNNRKGNGRRINGKSNSGNTNWKRNGGGVVGGGNKPNGVRQGTIPQNFEKTSYGTTSYEENTQDRHFNNGNYGNTGNERGGYRKGFVGSDSNRGGQNHLANEGGYFYDNGNVQFGGPNGYSHSAQGTTQRGVQSNREQGQHMVNGRSGNQFSEQGNIHHIDGDTQAQINKENMGRKSYNEYSSGQQFNGGRRFDENPHVPQYNGNEQFGQPASRPTDWNHQSKGGQGKGYIAPPKTPTRPTSNGGYRENTNEHIHGLSKNDGSQFTGNRPKMGTNSESSIKNVYDGGNMQGNKYPDMVDGRRSEENTHTVGYKQMGGSINDNGNGQLRDPYANSHSKGVENNQESNGTIANQSINRKSHTYGSSQGNDFQQIPGKRGNDGIKPVEAQREGGLPTQKNINDHIHNRPFNEGSEIEGSKQKGGIKNDSPMSNSHTGNSRPIDSYSAIPGRQGNTPIKAVEGNGHNTRDYQRNINDQNYGSSFNDGVQRTGNKTKFNNDPNINNSHFASNTQNNGLKQMSGRRGIPESRPTGGQKQSGDGFRTNGNDQLHGTSYNGNSQISINRSNNDNGEIPGKRITQTWDSSQRGSGQNIEGMQPNEIYNPVKGQQQMGGGYQDFTNGPIYGGASQSNGNKQMGTNNNGRTPLNNYGEMYNEKKVPKYRPIKKNRNTDSSDYEYGTSTSSSSSQFNRKKQNVDNSVVDEEETEEDNVSQPDGESFVDKIMGGVGTNGNMNTAFKFPTSLKPPK